MSAFLSQNVNGLQSLECTNRQISSSCERQTVLLRMLSLINDGLFKFCSAHKVEEGGETVFPLVPVDGTVAERPTLRARAKLKEPIIE